MDTAIQTVTEMITQRGYKITKSDDDIIVGTNPMGENIIVFTQSVASLLGRSKSCSPISCLFLHLLGI